MRDRSASSLHRRPRHGLANNHAVNRSGEVRRICNRQSIVAARLRLTFFIRIKSYARTQHIAVWLMSFRDLRRDWDFACHHIAPPRARQR